MDNTDPKCLLCGKSVSLSYFQACQKQKTKDHLYFKWAQSYSKSLCDLLDLDSSFQVLFQDADYCTSCQHIIHDMDFTLRTLKSLEIRITSFRTEIQGLLHFNRANLQDIVKPEVSETSLNSNTLTFNKVIRCICDQLPPPKSCVLPSIIATDGEMPVRSRKPAPASVKARRSSVEKVSNIYRVLLGKKGLSKSERIKLNKMQRVTRTAKLQVPKTKIVVTTPLNVTKNNVRVYKSAGNLGRTNQALKPGETVKIIEISKSVTAVDKLTESPVKLSKSEESAKTTPAPTTPRIRVNCTFENCSYSCFNDLELSAHILGQHHGDTNPYHCPQCPLKYTNASNLKYHIRQHHAEKPSDCQAFLSCSYCSKKFTAEEESGLLKRHEALHARSPIFSCVIPKCKTRQFSSSVDLKNHVALKHEETVPVSKCLECNLVCANPKSLRKHIKNIHCERNPALKCKECSYIGRVPSDIALHMTKHSDERNFHCQECNASYKNKCSLGFHIKNVHLKPGDKKHKCSQCPMAFSQASILKKHEQSHATCRLYACKKCDTRFKHIATLQAHEKHTCKGNSVKKTSINTRSKKTLQNKTGIIFQDSSQENSDDYRNLRKSGSETDDSEPTMNSYVSISTEEVQSDSTSGDSEVAMLDFPDPLEDIKTDISGSNDLDTLICSADTGDYNWINPELFGEEFATLDIFEEAETSSLISSVLPLHGSNIEVIWE